MENIRIFISAPEAFRKKMTQEIVELADQGLSAEEIGAKAIPATVPEDIRESIIKEIQLYLDRRKK